MRNCIILLPIVQVLAKRYFELLLLVLLHLINLLLKLTYFLKLEILQRIIKGVKTFSEPLRPWNIISASLHSLFSGWKQFLGPESWNWNFSQHFCDLVFVLHIHGLKLIVLHRGFIFLHKVRIVSRHRQRTLPWGATLVVWRRSRAWWGKKVPLTLVPNKFSWGGGLFNLFFWRMLLDCFIIKINFLFPDILHKWLVVLVHCDVHKFYWLALGRPKSKWGFRISIDIARLIFGRLISPKNTAVSLDLAKLTPWRP